MINPNNWVKYEFNAGHILYKGNFSSWHLELDRLILFLNNEYIDELSIVEYISSIRGNFSLVICTKNRTIISVDHVCSAQLYYLNSGKKIIVTDDITYFKKQTDIKINISNFSKLQILMSGYTLFEDTLFKKIKSFTPGQVFLSNSENVSINNINNYQIWFGEDKKQTKSLHYLQSKFNDIILKIMSEIINSLNNRQVVVPLSGGYDSRLIVSLLRHYNYENVVCFTYGMENNFEALAAKGIANSLGYEWIFVNLDLKEQIDFYKSDEFFSYLEYADTANSVPYYQGLYAIKYLKDNNKINRDAVFLNGNSGDFITGGHISRFYKFCNQYYLCKDFYKIVIRKYYSLWGYLKISKNIKKITNKINYEHNNLEKKYNLDISVCDFIYYYEFVNRQSKYVIQGQKTFEYYGYDWRMPLWDSKMLEFWPSVPNKYKNGQVLYKSTLLKYNYSNIWSKSEQINKYQISFPLVKYTRRFFKLLVVVLTGGNHGIWDRIDRVFFLYFYDITRMLCSVSYRRVLSSFFRHPRHNVSFDVDRYISSNEKRNQIK
jgi:asparagine synthase (glutamine-hydrolysing)